jgi:hypothetical protein
MKATKAITYQQLVQAEVAKALCQERAVECGYYALTSALEGDSFGRNKAFNLMRRLMRCVQRLDKLEDQSLRQSLAIDGL